MRIRILPPRRFVDEDGSVPAFSEEVAVNPGSLGHAHAAVDFALVDVSPSEIQPVAKAMLHPKNPMLKPMSKQAFILRSRAICFQYIDLY